eukprot:Seg373.2 transcript_id=Seg373.2/GoldUCD/mRNA.D3Y31 product="Protein GPR107" protein_id=Seg373.2/GoldUCD/D3Y31
MVDITDFSFTKLLPKKKHKVGFSLEKTGSDGVSSYMEQHTDKCILQERDGIAKQVEMMLFTLDLAKEKIVVERFGNSFKTLNISKYKIPDEAWDSGSPIEYLKRLVIKNLGLEGVLPPVNGSNKDGELSEHTKSGITKEDDKQFELPFNKAGNKFSGTITLLINEPNEGLYNLYFHNCQSASTTPSKIAMKLRIIERNDNTFLSAGEIPLPTIYGVISTLFFIAGCVYIVVLRSTREWTFKIHYLMVVVVFLKSFSLVFHSVNYYYIGKDGQRMESWAVLFYITHLLKGALMFTCIVLIGTGFFFVKQVLSTKEKRIFMIVIPLQILANVASIMIDSTEEGKAQYKTWNQIFILVDLICCGTVLFPVVWSIRHLQEAAKTDGKAAISLAKLKLFRHFYVMIVCYIYFTRIIVYLIKITVPFKYVWLDPLCTELAALAFFIVTGYKFRPASSNPYLHVPSDDELDDIEMNEISMQSGIADGLVRVNPKSRKTEENHST